MKTLFLVLFLCVAAASAVELDPYNYKSGLHYCYLDGLRYTFAISNADYAKMRKWNPSEDASPPVTPKRALELARARLARIKRPKSPGWDLVRISLEPIGGISYPNGKWMYVVTFYLHINVFGTPVAMNFIVTMDDKLVEPIVEPEKRNQSFRTPP